MACTAGPVIDNNGIIFYIDAANLKSFNNNILSSLVSTTAISYPTQSTDGFLFNQYNKFDSFDMLDISSLNAITVYAIVNNQYNNSGSCFNITSDTSLVNYAQLVNQVSPHIEVSTVASTDTVAMLPSYTTHQVTLIDEKEISTVASTDTVAMLPSYTAHQVTLIDEKEISTVASTDIEICDYKPQFELSFGIKNKTAFAVNRVNDKEFIVYNNVNENQKDLYQITFKTLSSVETSPVSLYQNNVLLQSANPTTGQTQFDSLPVQLFNVKNSGQFAQYGIRSIIIYDNETDLEQSTKINNLIGEE